MTAAAPSSNRWLFGPVPDLLLGCGLLYLCVFATLSVAGGAIRGVQPAFFLPLLVMLFSMPHYGGTLLRVYEERADRRSYAIFSVWVTLAVLAAFALSTHDAYFGSLMFTVYLTWSPWHYTGQNYGLAVMFARRRGVDLNPLTKRWLYASFLLSYAIVFLVLHTGDMGEGYNPGTYAGHSVAFLPLGIPTSVGGVLLAVAVGGYVLATLVSGLWLLRGGSARDLAPVGALALTQALWFAIPFAAKYWGLRTGFTPIDSQFTIRDYSIWIFAGHGIQYLWVTTYYARASKRWHGIPHYLGKAGITGIAIWTLPFVLFMPGALGGLSFDAGLALVVAAAVNIHHFILDGAIWKLRNTRVASVLIRSEGQPVAESASRFGAGRGLVWSVAGAGLAVALFAFWQEHSAFPRALAAGELEGASAALDRLAWVGQDRARHRYRLADAHLRAGELEPAIAQTELGLAMAPDRARQRRLVQLRAASGDWQAVDEGALALFRETGNAAELTSISDWLVSGGETERALVLLERGIEEVGPTAKLHIATARVARGLGRGELQARHFREAYRLDPSSVSHANDLAWLLATSSDESVRDPIEAIRIALATTQGPGAKDPNLLDTLAAGYAAAGRFDDAVTTAGRAVELASSGQEPVLRDQIQERLELYRESRPYVEGGAPAGS